MARRLVCVLVGGLALGACAAGVSPAGVGPPGVRPPGASPAEASSPTPPAPPPAAPAWASAPARDDAPSPPTRVGSASVDGAKIRIDGGFEFSSDSKTLRPSAVPILDDVATLLRARPEIEAIEIQGHGDGTPDKY